MSVGSVIKNLFFKNADVCNYKDKCDCYEESSVYCNQEFEHQHCGIFKRICRGEIKEYKKDW